jgi:transcriptional regulator with XRE-family HTH domain
MDTISDDPAARIARRLRLERNARDWSQGDLAQRSGVSKAMISKIEREEVSPTAVILVRLAAAFDLTLAGLLVRAEGEGDRVSRAAEQPIWRDPGTGYLRRQVFNRPDHPLELVKVKCPRVKGSLCRRLPTRASGRRSGCWKANSWWRPRMSVIRFAPGIASASAPPRRLP